MPSSGAVHGMRGAVRGVLGAVRDGRGAVHGLAVLRGVVCGAYTHLTLPTK